MSPQTVSRYPRAAKKLLRFSVWIYLAYVALCFVILLPALNFAAPWATMRYLNRSLEHEILIFNPFTLNLELRGARLTELTGHEPVALDQLSLNLSIETLWQPGLVLDELALLGLNLHVLRNADGRFHFEDLTGGDRPSKPADTEATELPPITVNELRIAARDLQFTDQSRVGGYTATYHDLDLYTENLSTLPSRLSDGGITLNAGAGGSITWRGDVALGDGHSSGELTIEQLDLSHLWEYESASTNFAVDSSALDLKLNYVADWQEQLGFVISDGNMRLHDIALLPNADIELHDTQLRLSDLSIDGVNADSRNKEVSIGAVRIDGVELTGYDRGGEVSVLQMLSLRDSAASNRPATKPPALNKSESNDWHVLARAVSLRAHRIEWLSDQLATPLLVTPLRADFTDFRWPGSSSTRFLMHLTANGQTTLDLEGVADTGGGDVTGEVALSRLPLYWFNPQLVPYLRASIDNGTLSMASQFELVKFRPERLSADVTVSNFDMTIDDSEDTAVALNELAVEGIAVDVAKSRIAIDSIDLSRPRTRLHIRNDGTLNVLRAVPDTAAAPAREISSSEPPSISADTGSPPTWTLRINKSSVHDGVLDFADDSLPLPFAAKIAAIDATVGVVDTREDQQIEIQLGGAVDGYAPVTIDGVVDISGEQPQGTLELGFRGVDIATMTPYSGAYAGYAIDSGTLTLNVSYTVNDAVIAGDNEITISQMKLGAPVESDLAVQLPLRLAIALLTDSEGVIDIDLPVSGHVDDPQFSLGKIIGRAISNLIIKAATAPFKLLASLVGSDADLERIAFTEGSADLEAEGVNTLNSLADALAQRPQLNLQVTGWTDAAADRRAIQALTLARQLEAEGISAAAIAGRDATFEQAIAARYATLQKPDPDAQVGEEDRYEAVLNAVELPPDALRELGVSRATTIKRQLVNEGQIDAARISVSYSDKDSGTIAKMSLDG